MNIMAKVLYLFLFLFSSVNAFAAQESLCASVKIEISQELTLERQAFDANMKINNGFPNLMLENINISVKFTDKDGTSVSATSNPNDTSASFFIRVSSMTGVSNNNISGTGTVSGSTTADIHWLIIPAVGAAKGVPQGTLYYVGATLSYSIGGESHTMEVTPDYIFVKPMPELALDYFLPYDVYSDDPFTPEIESVVPFPLGLRIKNAGKGAARNVKIESAQPKITDNKQGLLVNFWIMESWLNNAPTSNTLLVDFGNISPNTSTTAQWIMGCSLSGRFTEFKAAYTHSDELGGQLTSLISGLNTHTLVQDVLVDLAGRDTIKDFLAKDNGVYKLYESEGIDSEVYDWSSSANLGLKEQIGLKIYYNLTIPQTTGFAYVKLPDPYSGQKIIREVVRSEGKYLKPENVWLSKTKNKDTKEWEYYFNLFDANSTGFYTVVFDDKTAVNRPPNLQFIPDYTKTEGQQLSFIVEASDPDGSIPKLSASFLPAGAAFVDKGDGTGLFDWTSQKGQAGKYEVTFRASDGALEDSQKAILTIEPVVEVEPDFWLTFSPSTQTINQGETTNYSLDTTALEGFNSEVSLTSSVSPQPSQGAINFVIQSPVIPAPNPVNYALAVNTTGDVSVGKYSITLIGVGGNKTHSVSTELVIKEKFDITTDYLPSGRIGESYSNALALKAGVSPYSWSILSGALPDSLTLDTVTGIISGAPTDKGYFTFTVQAMDASNPVKSAVKDFSITVWPQPSEVFGEGALFKVTDTTALDGAGVILLFKDGYKEVYSFADAEVNNTAINDVFGIFTTPFIKFPIYKGDEWVVKDNISLDGYPVEVKYNVLETDETVVVPAGTFKNCVRLQETITFPNLFTPDSLAPNTIIRWFAPKVGIIKVQIFRYNNSVSTGELKQYSVAEQKNKDYFPLKKGNYWEFVWDKYKSLGPLTEKYIIAEYDSNIITARLKNPWVNTNDLYPYPNQGITDGTPRVPSDTSIIARIQSSLGLDEERLAMQIKTNGTQFYQVIPMIKQAGLGKANDYWVSFNKPAGVSTNLTADTLTDSTALWADGSLIGMMLNPNTKQQLVFPITNNISSSIVINGDMSIVAKAGDVYAVTFGHSSKVDVSLNAQDASTNSMSPYGYSFKTENQFQHDTAKQNLPATTLDISNPNEYVLSVSPGTLLEGAKIKYSPDELIAPHFGPLNEIPNLDAALGIGVPVNLEPAVVFNKPVTLFIPCPGVGVSDLTALEIYGYHPLLGWRPASEIDGWMSPHSRKNHPELSIPGIEFQVYHFTGVQAGKPINSVSVYSTGAYYVEGTYRNSLSVDIKSNFVNNSTNGWLKFYGITQAGRVTMLSISIQEIKHGSNGEVIIKGGCKVNNISGYSFSSTMKDVSKPSSGNDEFSIEITGPNNFKFSASGKKLTGGDVEIIWQ